MEQIPAWVKYTAKACLTALAVAVSYLSGILTGDQTLADVTFQQWLILAGLVLGAWGVVYAVPNGAKPVSSGRV